MSDGSVPHASDRRIERSRRSLELLLDNLFRPGDWAATLSYYAGLQGRVRAVSHAVDLGRLADDPGRKPLRLAFASDFHAGATTLSEVASLRGILTRVASDDALAQLSAEVRRLAAKVDQVASTANSGSNLLSSLEQRIAVIADDGAVLERYVARRFTSLPLVVGKGAETHAKTFLAMVANYPRIRSEVKAVVFVGERRWNLRLAGGLDVRLPEAGVEAALDRLIRLVPARGQVQCECWGGSRLRLEWCSGWSCWPRRRCC